MADELKLQLSLTFEKNGAVITRQLSDQFDVAGSATISGTPSIGTSDEVLALGDVATNGYLLLHNLNATNYIEFGSDGASYPNRLNAGEFGVMRWNGAAIHAKANTAACLLEYILISN